MYTANAFVFAFHSLALSWENMLHWYVWAAQKCSSLHWLRWHLVTMCCIDLKCKFAVKCSLQWNAAWRALNAVTRWRVTICYIDACQCTAFQYTNAVQFSVRWTRWHGEGRKRETRSRKLGATKGLLDALYSIHYESEFTVYLDALYIHLIWMHCIPGCFWLWLIGQQKGFLMHCVHCIFGCTV